VSTSQAYTLRISTARSKTGSYQVKIDQRETLGMGYHPVMEKVMDNWERLPGDEELLKRLVDHEDEILDENAVSAFKNMYYMIKNKQQKLLTDKQRSWTEAIYEKHDVQKYYSENLVSTGKVKKGKTQTFWWEQQENKPLKPPGR
jgi:hypothetical protein